MGNKISDTIPEYRVWASDGITASQDSLAFTLKTGDSESMMFAMSSEVYLSAAMDLSTCYLFGSCGFEDTQDGIYLCSGGDTTTSCSTPGWAVTKGDTYYLVVLGVPGTDISGNYYFYNLAAVVICSLIAVGLLCTVGFFCQRSKRQRQQPQPTQPSIIMVQSPPPQQNPVIIHQGNVV